MLSNKLRLKTYRNDKAKHDCEDIVIKLNEVGSNCPRFVTANLNNVPITTSDAFDLAKLSMNIEHVLRLESHVSDSFATLKCLQGDFNSILKRCSTIDMLADEVMALKLLIAAKGGGLPLPQPDTSTNKKSDIEIESDDSSVFSETSDDELLVLDADDKQEEPAPVLTKQKVVKQRTVRDHESKMTEDGFKLVENSGKLSRTFTNSSLKH